MKSIFSQEEKELDYFLGLVPEDFKSASFNDWTIWDAYARGRLPNKRWSEVFDNGEYHSMEIITKDDKTYKYYPIANPQPYLTVIQEHVSTLEEPERSRELLIDAAIWSKRIKETTDYLYSVHSKYVDLIHLKLSGFGWVIRLLGSLFLILYMPRLGEFSSSGLGVFSRPFEYSVWIGLWLALWSPIYFAFQRVKKDKPKAEQLINHKDEIIDARNYFIEKFNSLPFVNARQQAGLDVHFNAFIYMINLIDQGRAQNLGQAQNLYEELKRNEQLNHQFQELQRQVSYNNKLTTINTFTNLMK
ncbi:hypothetical protein [Streptococcus infantis]|nr:hypothetical protein [Streptococcus infantis]EIG40732.1 hypothetical protein HMPREF1111_1649 [Streptococcus infantis ATCC 700779]SUN81523.1 Uncharacterised protein [Streptococcus infantis]